MTYVSAGNKKQRNWFKRIMRTYNLTPQKIVMILTLTFFSGFLLHHFFLSSRSSNDHSFDIPDPRATIIKQGGKVRYLSHAIDESEEGDDNSRSFAARSTTQLSSFFEPQRLRTHEEETASLLGDETKLQFKPINQTQREKEEVDRLNRELQELELELKKAAEASSTGAAATSAAGSKSDATKTTPSGDAKVVLTESSTKTDSPKASIATDVSTAPFATLTAPNAPLGEEVDPSALYDSAERRAARQKILAAEAGPLPESVKSRKINNEVFTKTNGNERPLNEEWRETVSTRVQQSVKAPGLLTSFTSPDGGLEMTLFMNPEGRIGYSMNMNARYSFLARQMKQEGLINSYDEVKGTFLLPALLDLGIDNHMCLFDTKTNPGVAKYHMSLTRGFSYSHPIPKAERKEYGESFNQLTLWNVEDESWNSRAPKQDHGPCGKFIIEFRLFNLGFGIRAFVNPLSKADSSSASGPTVNPYPEEGEFVPIKWSVGVRLQDGVADTKCTANNYEEPFISLSCPLMKESMMTPVTLSIPDEIKGEKVKNAGQKPKGPRVIGLVQSSGVGFIRSTAVAPPLDRSRPFQTQLVLSTRGEAPFQPRDAAVLGVAKSPLEKDQELYTTTSWHVVLFASSLKHLPHSSHLIPLMCDPPTPTEPSFVDSRWVPSGKLMRITKFTTEYSKKVIDWTQTHNFPIVHFDAGWYGDEYKKESSAQAVLPLYAQQLKMAEVGAYANSKGVRVSLYVNELALRDTEQLTKIFPSWGVAGIKFGFVEVSDARAMRILHQRILAFGKAGLFVNVHDSYRPRGLSRSYPFLVAQEGVRGEERTPDSLHHTILPFVRIIQGSADYTPRYLNGAGLKCTKAHQLALPFFLYSPIQSLFWAEPLEAVSQSVAEWNKELVTWTRMPTTWDDTRFLAASMGEYGTVARRDGDNWFVASITNTKDRALSVDLNVLWRNWPGHPALPSQLPLEAGYIVHSYKDGYWKARHDPFGVKVQPRKFYWLKPPKEMWVNGKEPRPPRAGLAPIENGIFKVELAPSGGHVLYLTPVTPETLKEIP